MVGLKAGGLGPLHHELQQLGLVEDPQHQLAVPDVVERERGLVFLVAPLDLRHLVVLVADGLAFTEQRLRDGLQAEGRKAPHRGLERVDAVDDDPARRRREQVALLARMGPPFDRAALPPQQELHAAVVGRLLQHAQVELDDVPADDDVRVVPLEPVVELFDHGLAGRAIDQRKGHGFVRPGWRLWRRLAQHEDDALRRAVQRNRIERFVLARLDVQRHDLQHGTVFGRGLELAVDDGGALYPPAFHPHAGGDEAFHQVAVVRAHVGLEQGNALGLQGARQPAELAKVLRIHTEDRFLMERLQFKLTQLHVRHGREVGFHRRPMPIGDERDAAARGQQHFPRPRIGCQPVLDLCTGGRVTPVAGKDEALEFG